MDIQKQIEYIQKQFEVETLSKDSIGMKDFKNITNKVLGEYLLGEAIEDQKNDLTKIFLVRDKDTQKICFYFSLRCGLLYRKTPRNNLIMGELEQELYQVLKEAKLNGNFDEIYEVLHNDGQDLDMLEELRYSVCKCADNQKCNDGSDSVNITYPAIELKEFVKNEDYTPIEDITFSFGALVFWGIIMPHVQTLSQLIGAKYLYLFSVGAPGSSLYHYYIRVLGFQENTYCVLKPEYDANCYTLIQEISELHTSLEIACVQNTTHLTD